MKTVTQTARLTGVSVRTLHHYDAIGLLKPTRVTEAGYRLYDDEALERLYLILLFREIGFPLRDIKGILDAPDFDRNRVLEKQIELLKAKRVHLQNLIHLAVGIQWIGVRDLHLDGFDVRKIDDYSTQAKALWGKTDAYREFAEKSKNRTQEQESALARKIMDFFVRLGAMKDQAPDSGAVQDWVRELQAFFTEHFYTCTPQILTKIGEMYAGGGSMTENIDAEGGAGTAQFALQAIKIYCSR